MAEVILFLMLALHIGDMGITFWMWLILFAIIKFIRLVIWFLEEN